MRTQILAVFLFAALPGAALAAETKVLAMNGQVELRPTREGAWTAASADAEVGEGGAVRTGPGGSAVLLMPNKTKVWLKENSNIELEQRQTLASRLALVFGKIKVRVPHLMRKERFEVRTPAAVCAVRGTEFTMGTNEEGQMDLQVLFGEVKLKFMIPPDKGPAEFNIPQGQGLALSEKGKATKPELLTPKAEREAMENWNPGLKASERQAGLREKENDRAQIKEFARATSQAEDTVKSFLNVVKESDLEAGRTLNDVHGNLVRVDQRMVRPYADEIQFYNIVKRANYADYTSPSGAFAYNGGAVTNRLDMMQITMNFNQDLPQRMEEWPGFFNDNSIKAEWASFVSANRTYADEIFVTAEGYRYDAGRDELVNNTAVVGINPLNTAAGGADRDVLMTGILQNDANSTAVEKLNYLSRLNVANTGTAGNLVYDKGGTSYNYAVTTPDSVLWGRKFDIAPGGADAGQLPAGFRASYSLSGDPVLREYSADAYIVGGKLSNNNFFWYATESYVTGNGGGIKSAGDFTNSSSDPFTLLKESAAEVIVSVKDAATAPGSWTSDTAAYAGISSTDKFKTSGAGAHYTAGTNIDVVFIPDLAVAAIQRMLPAITALNE
jgi:hypothetical protein